MKKNLFIKFGLIVILAINARAASFKAVCVGVDFSNGGDSTYYKISANLLKDALKSQSRSFSVKTLLQGEATKSAIQAAIYQMCSNSENTCVFSFAGHGDADPIISVLGSHITPSELKGYFGTHIKFICYLDACNSGGFVEYTGWPTGAGEIYAACEADEESGKDQNGNYFTYYLAEKIEAQQIITARAAYEYAKPLAKIKYSGQNACVRDNYNVGDGDIYLWLDLPVANFSSDYTVRKTGQGISFTDQSSEHPDKWSWTFTGASPSSATTNQKLVTYSQGGLYQVSLTVTNTRGSDTETKSNYIAIIPKAPTNLSVTGNIGLSPQLSWTGSTGANYYRIYRKGYWTAPYFQKIDSTTSTNYTDYSLVIEEQSSADDQWYYRVTAVLAGYGESDPSWCVFVYGEGIENSHENVKNTFEPGSSLPDEVALLPNYPNPANPTTTIHFTMPQTDRVKLSIYNIQGQVVSTLIDGYASAGVQSATWDGKDAFGNTMPSGIYIYRLTVGKQTITRRLTLMK